MAQSQVDSVLFVASQEVGVHEVGGNNCGPRVEEYLRAVGLGAGNPWCAAFVCWCLQKAKVKGGPCTGDTWTIEAWAQNHNCLYNENPAHPEAPLRGDIFLLLDSNNRPMHTGLVTEVHTNGTVSTIEGNTGLQSDTDGDGVARKSRRIQDCSFVRWANVTTSLEAVVKIFANNNGKSIILDGKTYTLSELTVNGSPCTSLELFGKYNG